MHGKSSDSNLFVLKSKTPLLRFSETSLLKLSNFIVSKAIHVGVSNVFNNFSIAFTCGVLGLLQFIYKFIRMASLAWQRDLRLCHHETHL